MSRIVPLLGAPRSQFRTGWYFNRVCAVKRPVARLLLLDDDATLVTTLTFAFEDAGHVVISASDGQEGLRLAREGVAELIVSDVNMPKLDGFSLCRKLREAGSPLPIILLTSRDNETDETLGLELGADDYLSKPFSTRVLLARVAALLRRDVVRRGPQADDTLTVGHLSLSAARLELRWRATPLITTVTEFKLVEALARRPGVVLTRDALITHCRGEDAVVGDRLIDTYVRRLRRKFEAIDPSFTCIEAVVGAGYRWRS